MVATTLSAVVTANVYTPTAAGRIQQGSHGFVRNIGMVDGRQKDSAGPAPEQDPAIEAAPLTFVQTQLATTVNGATLGRVVIPRDMSLSEWDISGTGASAVKTILTLHGLGVQYFYIPNVDQRVGQNVWGGLAVQSSDPAPASATIAQVTGPVNDIHFVSHWSLRKNQGFTLSALWYGVSSALESQIENDLHVVADNLLTKLTLLADEIALYNRSSHYLSLQWGLGGTLQWLLMLPSVYGSHTYAVLFKSVDSGHTWKQADYHPTGTHRPRLIDSLGDRRLALTHIVENGVAIFDFGPDVPPWHFRDPDDLVNGFVSPAGPVHIEWFGTAGVLCLNGMGFRKPIADGLTLGYCRSGPFTLPPWVNSDSAALSFKLYPRDTAGNDVSSTPDVAVTARSIASSVAGQYYVQVDMKTTGTGGAQAPVVLGVQEIRQPVVEVISVSKGDLGPDILDITIEQSRKFRGSTARIQAKNEAGQWSGLNCNELVTVDLALVSGTAGTPPFGAGTVSTGAAVRQFVGQVEERDFQEDAEEFPNTPGTVTLQLRDWEMRLSKKKMEAHASYGGWGAAEAASYILARSGFHPNSSGAQFGDYFDFRPDATRNTGIDPSVIIPTTAVLGGKGHSSFHYTDEDSVITALDEIFTNLSYEWGIYPDGIIRCWQIGTFDPSNTYTLDDSTFDPESDCIQRINVQRTIAEYYNTCIVHAKDANGIDQEARVYDLNSIYGTYGTTANYVGDDLWDTHHAPAGANPWMAAQARLAALGSYSALISWQTDLRLSLFPRHKVIVNLRNDALNLGIPLGSEFIVTGKRTRYNLTGGQLTGSTEFILGVPKLAVGGMG